MLCFCQLTYCVALGKLFQLKTSRVVTWVTINSPKGDSGSLASPCALKSCIPSQAGVSGTTAKSGSGHVHANLALLLVNSIMP